jgi:hypothetical protein
MALDGRLVPQFEQAASKTIASNLVLIQLPSHLISHTGTAIGRSHYFTTKAFHV